MSIRNAEEKPIRNAEENLPIRKSLNTEPIDINKEKEESKNLQNQTATVLNKVSELIGDVKVNMGNNDVKRTTSVNQLKSRVQNILDSLAELQKTSDQNERSLKEKKDQLELLMKQKRAFQEKVGEHTSQLDKTNKLVQEQTGEISRLKQQINDSGDKQKIDQLEQQINTLKLDIASKDKKISNMKNISQTDSNAYETQIKELERILGSLQQLDKQIKNQGSSIDNTFDAFDKEVSNTGVIDTAINNISNTVQNVGDMVSGMFGGGKHSKKSKSPRYHKRSKESLKKIAKKWGIKDIKKYRNKKELIIALTLIIIYKSKSKIYTKTDLLVIAKNLDIKTSNKMRKVELKSKIDKRLRRFSFRDIY